MAHLCTRRRERESAQSNMVIYSALCESRERGTGSNEPGKPLAGWPHALFQTNWTWLGDRLSMNYDKPTDPTTNLRENISL